jgi:hypothetical protein
VPGNPVTEHPRLFLSEEELKERLEKEKSPVAKGILANALKDTAFMDVDIDAIEEGEDRTAENLVGGPFSKTSVGFNAFGVWRKPMVELGKVVEQGSFRYVFGDREAGKRAKKALLKLCSFKKWNVEWMLENKFWTYYPVGYTLKPVAYGYDMLYDILTEEEQKLIRDAIIEKGLKLFHRDMVEMNRMPSNLTNHIAVLAGGHGLAAMAIYGDSPENEYLEPYLSGIITKAKTFIDRTYHKDGSYLEPFNYQSMASRSIAEFMASLEKNFGIDYSSTTNVKNFYLYPLYATHKNKITKHPGSLLMDLHSTHTAGAVLDFGDAGRTYDGFTQLHSWWFIHRTGNPFLYYYNKPYWEKGNGGYMSYLWFRDDITPISRETLPSSRFFEAQGVMVMRSGWKDSSTVISTRFGPHSNHYHFDQGSFQIMTNGEVLLDDPGVGPGGYYENLKFPVFNIQAIGHNVMLVDHDPESQKPADYKNGITALQDWPRVKHVFSGEIVDAIKGDLTPVYKDKLTTYTRNLLYNKSGPLFLFDRVESKSPEGHVYDWLFHSMHNSDGRSISYSNSRMTVNQENARLTMDILSPEIDKAIIRDAAAAARGGQRLEENFITLSSKPNLKDVDFLAVIVPEAKPGGGNYGNLPLTSRINAPGWIGAKVEYADNVDFGFFRAERVAAGTIEGFKADAEQFIVSLDKNGMLRKLFFGGSSFSGRGLSVKSDKPISFAIAFRSSGKEVEIKAEKSASINLHFNKQLHSEFFINGLSSGSWRYDKKDKVLIVEVPEGRSNFLLQSNDRMNNKQGL